MRMHVHVVNGLFSTHVFFSLYSQFINLHNAFTKSVAKSRGCKFHHKRKKNLQKTKKINKISSRVARTMTLWRSQMANNGRSKVHLSVPRIFPDRLQITGSAIVYWLH